MRCISAAMGGRRYGTDPTHMPSSHRRYAEWTPERFRRWGASIGPQTERLIIAILASRPHPEQGFRTGLGILRLYRDIGHDRAETVSARAIEIGGLNSKTIASLIATHKGKHGVSTKKSGRAEDHHCRT